MKLPSSKTLRVWLITVIIAVVLFLGNIAVEVLGDDIKERLGTYRYWVWLVLGSALLVTIAGAIREAKKQRLTETPLGDSNGSNTERNITGKDITDSVLTTGDGNSINQNEGGNSRVLVTVNNQLHGSARYLVGEETKDKKYQKGVSSIHWEERDFQLLSKYFSLCAEHYKQFEGHEHWHDRDVRERLLDWGLANQADDGQVHLTPDGILFCCREGKIPQSVFHVAVRVKFVNANSDSEESRQFNNQSVLSLYFKLLAELTPLFERTVEIPELRDAFGRSIIVSDYPQLAIIEALVNFLIHRDYFQDDMGFIVIHPDKIVFENPGQSEYPIEELLNATDALKPKYCRNQRLIEAFNYAHLNQREGKGIQRIKEALKKNGSFRPDGSIGLSIENDLQKNRFILTLYKRERPSLPKRVSIIPPTPSLFIGREEDIYHLKGLLGVSSDKVQKPTVIVRGVPGVGKTTLASVLAQDADLARLYPDGVLWTSLGNKSFLMSIFSEWGRAFGENDILKAAIPDEAANRLAKLFQDKKILFIVDDVWDSSSAAIFSRIQSQYSGLLITTRLTAVAQYLARKEDEIYTLAVLDAEDALKLFKAIAPEIVSKYPEKCRELVKDLEYLPLAIHVASRLLKNELKMGWGVENLIDEIREGAKILESNTPPDRAEIVEIPTVQALLKKSTDILDEETKDRFAYLGVFAPKPATFDLEALKFVWKVDDPKPTVRKLVDFGLLEPIGERFQMHALLVAHARSLLS
jgi:hypothetical protein